MQQSAQVTQSHAPSLGTGIGAAASAVTFKEDDIRPDALMAEADRLHSVDVGRLLARRSEFVEVGCPACDSRRRRQLWVKDDFTFCSCLDCETAYVNPRPAPPALEDYYRYNECWSFWSKHIFPASEAARREKLVKPRLARLIEICDRQGTPRDGLFIEVGAGQGTFCDEAARSGRFGRVVAIEPTPDLAAACRQRGVEVIEKPIEHVALQSMGADVVVSFEVIEHLFSPGDFVASCAATLKQNGLLVLSCPNLKGFEIAALGTATRTVDPEHLNYFHPASLSALLARHGLEVLEVLTPGKLDAEIARKAALGGHIDLSDQPFLKTLLIDDWDRLGAPFQAFLEANKLSAHMWTVARKR